MTTLRWLDAVVIIVYMAAMVMMGLWFARRQTSTEAYFVAKRSIPNWAMGVSIYAALISSITFVVYPGSAYAGNWNELVPGFMVVGVLILVGSVIIPFSGYAVDDSTHCRLCCGATETTSSTALAASTVVNSIAQFRFSAMRLG
jgi:SSS family solute:Na+ symporter